MSTHADFIHTIENDPAADAPRLVFADWLDEQSEHHAAEYLRAELELAKLPLDSSAAPPLRTRLWKAWANVNPDWLATFTQPRMLRANPTPFPSLWINFSLGKIRPGEHTYDSWPYESLPPLMRKDWGASKEYFAPDESNPHDPAEFRRRHKQMAKAVAALGATLPPAYVGMMKFEVQQFATQSPTDCFFDLPDDYTRVRHSKSGDAVHVHFYCDSQSCVLWDLYIHTTGAHCVIARHLDYFETPEKDSANIWFVAPSFEAFVHRIWLENMVWYHQHGDELGDEAPSSSSALKEIEAYVDHYRTSARK